MFTPRAIFYRFEKKLHTQKISVAVVVQKMVTSEKSGVAFSVHPVTQDSNQLIIEAGYGLGEAIVSGSITPDSYVVEKQPRRIIDKNIQTQLRGLYRAENGGNEWQNISKAKGEKQVLSDEKILELSEIILKIENHYGFPCDIEWAYEKGRFYIVQSRPITTSTKIIKWDKLVERRQYPLAMYMKFLGLSKKVKRITGLDFNYQNWKYENNAIYQDLNEFESLKSKILYANKTDTKFASKLANICYKKCDELLKISRILSKRKNKRNFLKEDFKKYIDAYMGLSVFLAIPLVVENISTNQLNLKLKKYTSSKKELEEIFNSLTISKKQTYSNKEQIHLIDTHAFTGVVLN